MTDKDVEDALAAAKAHLEGKDAMVADVYKAMVPTAEDLANPYFENIQQKAAKKERRQAKAKKAEESGERMATEESYFQPLFSTWVTKNKHLFSVPALFELKATPTTRLPFDRLEPHQEAALLAVEGDGHYHRITHHFGDAKKPADAFLLRGRGYIPMMFRIKEPRNKTFYMVRIGDFIKSRDTCGEASLTEETAGRIGVKCEL